MIKGCSRKVIVVKDPGSNLFEEAYFIVSPGESERKYGDFLLEANRIIRAKTVSGYERQRRKSGIFQLIIGFVVGAFAALTVAYFLF